MLRSSNVETSSIMACLHYNSDIETFINGKSMQPGKLSEKETPIHLFNTWLDYRLSTGQKRSDIIREANLKLDRKYSNNTFYLWIQSKKTVAEVFMDEIIFPELANVYKFYFEQQGFPTKGIDFEVLAQAFQAPIKRI
tara:strand:+ start:1047 stop:1460 length:414 start_codon:yes stop_codon:yes gene_type:complete